MKTLIITGDFPPNLSGVGDYSDRLAGSLLKLGVNVELATAVNADTDRAFRVHPLVHQWSMQTSESLKHLASGFDIVNIQYPSIAYGRSLAINLLPAILRRRSKVIVTVHDARVMRWRWRARTWPMLNACGGVIHVDPGDWAVLRTWMTLGERPRACIPIASNVEVVACSREDRQRWREELNIAHDELAVAFFGIIYPHKGLDELLDATARLRAKGRQIRTVVVGDFDREADYVKPMLQRLSRADVTHVRGASLERVSQCLHACDLAALPFHSGTSVNRSSMLATLAHGLPTVTTRGHVTPPNIEKIFPLSLVGVRNTDALTDAIEQLLTDTLSRDRLQAASIESAKMLSWESVAKQHVAFFESILGGAR